MLQFKSGKIELVEGDITKQEVDAIVNAANNTLLPGGGVCGAIHMAAGAKLALECISLGGCRTGEAKITKGYNLPAKHVIHTPGPIWHGGKKNEKELLGASYRNSMKAALTNGLTSIAFPSISTGIFGFPVELAATIALETAQKFLLENPEFELVRFVLWGEKDYNHFREVLGGFPNSEGERNGNQATDGGYG